MPTDLESFEDNEALKNYIQGQTEGKVLRWKIIRMEATANLVVEVEEGPWT